MKMEFNSRVSALEGCFHYYKSQKSNPEALLCIKKAIDKELEVIKCYDILLCKLETHKLFFVLLSHCQDFRGDVECLKGAESVTDLFPYISLSTFLYLVSDCNLSFCLEECLVALDKSVSISIIDDILSQLEGNLAEKWSVLNHLYVGFFGVLSESLAETEGKTLMLLKKLCCKFITLITNCQLSNPVMCGRVLATVLSSVPYITSLLSNVHKNGEGLGSIILDWLPEFNILMDYALVRISNVSMLTVLDWNEYEMADGMTMSCTIFNLLQECRDRILEVLCLPWFTSLSSAEIMKKLVAVTRSVLSIQTNDSLDVGGAGSFRTLLCDEKLNEFTLRKTYLTLHTVQFEECRELLQWIIDNGLLLKHPIIPEFVLVLVSSFGLEDQLYLYKNYVAVHLDSGLFRLNDFSMITCSMNQLNPGSKAYSLVMFMWFYMQDPFETLTKFMNVVVKNSKLLPTLEFFLERVGDLFCGIPPQKNPLVCSVMLNYLKHNNLAEDEKSGLVEFCRLVYCMEVIDSEKLIVGVVNPLLEENNDCLIIIGLDIWRKLRPLIGGDPTCLILQLLKLLDRSLRHSSIRLKAAVIFCLRDLVSLESPLTDWDVLFDSCSKLTPDVQMFLHHMKLGGDESCYCDLLVQNARRLCSENSFPHELRIILCAKALMRATEDEFLALLASLSQFDSCLRCLWMSDLLPGLCQLWMMDMNVIKRCLEQYSVAFKKAYDEESQHLSPEENLDCFQKWITCHNSFCGQESVTGIVLMFVMCIQKQLDRFSTLQIQKYVSLLLLIEDPLLKNACVTHVTRTEIEQE